MDLGSLVYILYFEFIHRLSEFVSKEIADNMCIFCGCNWAVCIHIISNVNDVAPPITKLYRVSTTLILMTKILLISFSAKHGLWLASYRLPFVL